MDGQDIADEHLGELPTESAPSGHNSEKLLTEAAPLDWQIRVEATTSLLEEVLSTNPSQDVVYRDEFDLLPLINAKVEYEED